MSEDKTDRKKNEPRIYKREKDEHNRTGKCFTKTLSVSGYNFLSERENWLNILNNTKVTPQCIMTITKNKPCNSNIMKLKVKKESNTP